MNNFLNDYKDFGNKEIYTKMNEIFDHRISGYGNDEICNRAREVLKKEIKKDLKLLKRRCRPIKFWITLFFIIL